MLKMTLHWNSEYRLFILNWPLCCVFSLMKAVIASPLCYCHVFQGVPVSALCDRFSSTDCIDLLPGLTHRVQRRAGNHLKRANENVLLLHRESRHRWWGESLRRWFLLVLNLKLWGNVVNVVFTGVCLHVLCKVDVTGLVPALEISSDLACGG